MTEGQKYNDCMDIIYLDNAATTRLHPAVAAEMARVESELFFNASALYRGSMEVTKAIERANAVVKAKIDRGGVGDVIFTSGATEANNMVILGKITNPRSRLVVLAGEHSSVYSPSVMLAQNGFQVDYVGLNSDGRVDLGAVKRLIKPDTALFVFGLINSDTGCMQNVGEVVRTVRGMNPKIHVHCDAVQGFCKYDFDAGALGLDSCVVSSHKINGPKGVGALWLRKGSVLKPIMYGGGQHQSRPGTENNSGIIGFGKAVEMFDTGANHAYVSALHSRLVTGLPKGCLINGANNNPYITNIMLPGILGNTVMNALSEVGIYVGMGAACSSKAAKNRTLLAMGIPEPRTKQVLRVSFGIFNTADDVDKFLTELGKILAKFKSM